MAQNPFDQASRYAAKLDPPGFQHWLFDGPHFAFVDWLDARTLPFPHDPERICDTVAGLKASGNGLFWAVPIEFNREPDPAMFGRLLIYLGLLWQELRQRGVAGGDPAVGAAVVNLTGRGQTSRAAEHGGLRTQLDVVERNMAHEEAATVLQGIAAGSIARCVLPWVPLMHGADASAILEQWQELAGAEPDAERRADYGGLALVFAEAAGRADLWGEALRRWNMVESQVVNRWKAEGEASALLRVLRKRFGVELPADLVAVIEACKDAPQLSRWLEAALDAASLDEFRQAVEPPHRNGA